MATVPWRRNGIVTRSGVPSPSELVAKNARLQGRVEAELGESEGGDIDITSRKEAEAELQLREARFRALIEGASDLIVHGIYLPARPEEAELPLEPAQVDEELQGHGEHILYIDDEESLVLLGVRFSTSSSPISTCPACRGSTWRDRSWP